MNESARQPPFTNVSAVALDFDGVVVDSMPLQESAWRRAARKVGAEESLIDQLCQRLYAGSAGERMFDGLPLGPAERRRLRAKKDLLWRRERDGVPLMEGVAKWLPHIAARYPVAIATTADRGYVEGVLSRHQLDPCVLRVVTDMDVPEPKPAPHMLMDIARSLQIGPECLCMVGDTVADFQMSLAAGAPFVLLGRARTFWNLPNAMYVLVRNWRELARLLLKQAA